jgi:hypothetical protein
LADNNSKLDGSEIKQTFSRLFDGVNKLIIEMKKKGSEEVLNGSISEAQKLLAKIIPYQNFYEKLKIAKDAFNEIENINTEKTEKNRSSQQQKVNEPEVENIDEEIFEEVEEFEEEEKVIIQTPQESFRIPILKALIYLGGSSEEEEIIEFVKKDMKNKLSKSDFEIPEGEDQERWKSNIYFETANMIDEGLLSNESTNKKWEIAQKGIDYLGKYAK